MMVRAMLCCFAVLITFISLQGSQTPSGHLFSSTFLLARGEEIAPTTSQVQACDTREATTMNNLVIADDKSALARDAWKEIQAALKESANDDKFLVALSGGSLPQILEAGLTDEIRDSVEPSKWHVFFADERHVAWDHEDSNLRACKGLLEKLGVSEDRIYGINANTDLESAAKEYEHTLVNIARVAEGEVPIFHLVLLGMGEDGHTCSLFPGHDLLNEHARLVAPISDSPKPPPKRITLTLPVLNRAKNVFFITAGGGKAEALSQATISQDQVEKLGDDALPAARVRPSQGKLIWFVDQAAASSL